MERARPHRVALTPASASSATAALNWLPIALPSALVVLQCRTVILNYPESIMGTLTIRIDDELERDLNQLAKVQHRTKSDLAREMLRKHIAVEQFRKLRRKALPLAEAAGYVTDEDIFRDLS